MWTREMDAMLIKLRQDGYSSSIIAGKLARHFNREVSRNAVVGRAYRLKLPELPAPIIRRSNRNETPWRRKRTKAKAPRKAAAMPRLPQHEIPKDDPNDVPTKTLMQLEWNDGCCRWPIGEKPIAFCGKDALPGLPYCEPHSARAFQNWPEVRTRVKEAEEKEVETVA